MTLFQSLDEELSRPVKLEELVLFYDPLQPPIDRDELAKWKKNAGDNLTARKKNKPNFQLALKYFSMVDEASKLAENANGSVFESIVESSFNLLSKTPDEGDAKAKLESAMAYLSFMNNIRGGNDAWALFRMGSCCAGLKKNDEAAQHYKKSLESKEDAVVHTALADLLWGLNEYKEQIYHYNKALQLTPEYVLADEGLKRVVTAFEKYSSEKFDKGEWKDAFFGYSILKYAKGGATADAFNKMAICCSNLDRGEDAINFFRESISLEDDRGVRLNFVRELRKAGHHIEAIKQYGSYLSTSTPVKLIKRGGQSVLADAKCWAILSSAVFVLSAAFFGGGYLIYHSKTLRHFAYEFKADRCPEGDLECSIENLEKAVEYDSSDIKRRLQLAGFYKQKGDMDSEFAQLSAVAEIEPDNIDARIKLAELYERANKPKLALGEYKKALAIDPQNGPAGAGLEKMIKALMPNISSFMIIVDGERARIGNKAQILVDQGDTVQIKSTFDDKNEDYIVKFEGDGLEFSSGPPIEGTLFRVGHANITKTGLCSFEGYSMNCADIVFRVPWLDEKDPRSVVGRIHIVVKSSSYGFDHYFGLGNAHFEKDEWGKAIEDYSAALKYRPNDSTTLNDIGASYASKGDYKKSLEYLLQATQYEQNDVTILRNLGDTYYELGQVENAAEQYKKALKINPKDSRTIEYVHVLVREKMPAFKQVKVSIDGKAFGVYPSGELRVDVGSKVTIDDVVGAVPWDFITNVVGLVGVKGTEDPQDLHRTFTLEDIHGNKSWKRYAVSNDEYAEVYRVNVEDNYGSRFGMFRLKFLKKTPTDLSNSIKGYWDNKDYKSALRVSLKFTELYPDLDTSHNKLGVTYYYLDRYGEALKEHKKALEIDPKDPILQFNVGHTYYTMGKYSDALPPLQEAVRLDPKNADYQRLLDSARSKAAPQLPDKIIINVVPK